MFQFPRVRVISETHEYRGSALKSRGEIHAQHCLLKIWRKSVENASIKIMYIVIEKLNTSHYNAQISNISNTHVPS
jgi:hypothetical protein